MNNPTTIRRGFTLIELMVSVSILVVVILGVGVVFRSTSSAVGMSQATMEMLSNVRAFQQNFDRDIQHLDRNGFMIIRQYGVNGGWRFDQISFVANGSFQHKTGTGGATPLADGFTANGALVWYGHLIFAPAGGAVSQYAPPYPAPSASLPPLLPSAVSDDHAAGFFATAPTTQPAFNTVDAANNPVPQSFVLGCHRFLLAPNSGSTSQPFVGPAPCAAFASAALGANYDPNTLQPITFLANGVTEGPAATPWWNFITSSRMDAVAQTPAQLMTEFWANQGTAGWAVNNYCYRFKSLRSVNDDSLSTANSVFRMHDQMLQGCTHFEIAWTDGSINSTTALGQCNWYGVTSPSPAYPTAYPTAPAGYEPAAVSGDLYDVTFPVTTSTNTAFPNGSFPKALRITIWVTDANDRLKGGREFVQYVHIPG